MLARLSDLPPGALILDPDGFEVESDMRDCAARAERTGRVVAIRRDEGVEVREAGGHVGSGVSVTTDSVIAVSVTTQPAETQFLGAEIIPFRPRTEAEVKWRCYEMLSLLTGRAGVEAERELERISRLYGLPLPPLWWPDDAA